MKAPCPTIYKYPCMNLIFNRCRARSYWLPLYWMCKQREMKHFFLTSINRLHWSKLFSLPIWFRILPKTLHDSLQVQPNSQRKFQFLSKIFLPSQSPLPREIIPEIFIPPQNLEVKWNYANDQQYDASLKISLWPIEPLRDLCFYKFGSEIFWRSENQSARPLYPGKYWSLSKLRIENN